MSTQSISLFITEINPWYVIMLEVEDSTNGMISYAHT